MNRLITIWFVLISYSVMAQSNDDAINFLVQNYSETMNIDCEIFVQTDVEGMVVPDKIVSVTFKDNGKPKVKGKGIALLPKKGMINQFRDLFSVPFQAIYLGKKKNNLIYKLVSLDSKSDWIIADIEFSDSDFRLHNSSITTRKHGTFNVEHHYEDLKYPSKSIITFDIKKFKLPLKFIGRTEKVSTPNSTDENVKGKVTLSYTYFN